MSYLPYDSTKNKIGYLWSKNIETEEKLNSFTKPSIDFNTINFINKPYFYSEEVIDYTSNFYNPWKKTFINLPEKYISFIDVNVVCDIHKGFFEGSKSTVSYESTLNFHWEKINTSYILKLIYHIVDGNGVDLGGSKQNLIILLSIKNPYIMYEIQSNKR